MIEKIETPAWGGDDHTQFHAMANTTRTKNVSWLDPDWLMMQACSRRRLDRTLAACGECNECILFKEAEPVIPDHMFSQSARLTEAPILAPVKTPVPPAAQEQRAREVLPSRKRRGEFVVSPDQPIWCRDDTLKSRACISVRAVRGAAACGDCSGCKAYDAGPPDLPESAFAKNATR